MIVVLEGVDGCGKTEVSRILAQDLKAKLISFPDDKAVTGPLIRSYLRNEWLLTPTDLGVLEQPGVVERVKQQSALTFQALQMTNRLERMFELRMCARQMMLHAVVARYWQSGWVYGQLDGLHRHWLMETSAGMAIPDLNILLDVDTATSLERQADRDGDAKPERYEGEASLMASAVKLYRDLWTDVTLRQPFKRPRSPDSGWVIIDATRSLEHVVDDVRRVVGQLLGC